MAVGTIPTAGSASAPRSEIKVRMHPKSHPLWTALQWCGSLKITVAMFLASVFILFIGTLAQDELNLPDVKAIYFNSWITTIHFRDFVPVTMFGEYNIWGSFPFPGGATIGVILLFNLIAAKITRFHIAAKGNRLVWGLIVSLVGVALTTGVLMSGHLADGLQGKPPVDYDSVWRLLQLTSVGITVALVATAFANKNQRKLTSIVLITSSVLMAILTGLILFGGESFRMSEPGLRIMWQLIQSSVAGGVLLVGLILVFGTRGGNVLIHVAVGLVMVGQFVFGDRQIEQRVSVIEGQTTNLAFKTDEFELAVVDVSDPDTDRVTVIADTLLKTHDANKQTIKSDQLPFDVRIVELFVNSDLRRAGPVEPNQATTGLGKSWIALKKKPEGGVSPKPNISSAYVELLDKSNGQALGTYLVSQFLNDQSQIFMESGGDQLDTVELGGKPYQLQLRYRREYKPYEITLTDVRRINYSASETPRDYSSYVTIRDKETSETQDGRIWMNNPVRYKGETFYQNQYSQVKLPDGRVTEMTGLQVVENAGWLIPYVACVLAFWGMLAHFGGTFLRFADRYDRMGLGQGLDALDANSPYTPSAAFDNKNSVSSRTETQQPKSESPKKSWWNIASPILAVSIVALFAVSAARPRSAKPNEFNWQAVGSIPVLHEGRIKPFDTVARNTLQFLSNRTSVSMANPEASDFAKMMGMNRKSFPATRWLVGVLAGDEQMDNAQVFRIDAKEVVDLFDLKQRDGHRYSFNELQGGLEKLATQVKQIMDLGKPEDQLTFAEKKFLEINRKLRVYNLLGFCYRTPDLPDLNGDPNAQQEFVMKIQQIMRISEQLEDSNPPAIIPPMVAIDPASESESSAADKPKWQALYPAIVNALRDRIFAAATPDGKPFEANPAIMGFNNILAATEKTPRDFDKAVSDYKKIIGEFPEAEKSERKAKFEAWFNQFNPIDLSKWLYIFTAVLCFSSFLVWPKQINRFAFWMLVAILIIHSIALISRIYITGRAPVINLYSSAVFIGWACVLAGLGIEAIFRLGLGNLVASVTGGASLMVAYGLDTSDTMHVLQAVLDTQFWLTTHVIAITLGYGATFLAGFIGVIAIARRMYATYKGSKNSVVLENEKYLQSQLYRMTYGVLCFAIFFSFIGTVLGGLWADDSWGRFWGWDPKENGALMIVLWNAAVLHARWDRLVGHRGFALFAIAGNIITAWSWFGTNQLGIGLHSYGFTSGILLLLGLFVLFNLAVIAAGWIFTHSTLEDKTTQKV
jgi:ABC-type transport system involved in cytochrome c biogenesis permease subunit